MLDWSISRIKSFLQFFIDNNPDLSDNILTASNWRTLTSIRDFLELFFQITKYTERQHTTIDRVLLLLDFLLDRYKIGVLLHVVDNFIKLAINTE